MNDTDPMYHRMQSEDRKAQMVAAGLMLAIKHGLPNVKRQDVADQIGIVRSLITHHFGEMDTLRKAIVDAAIAQKEYKVIGEAIVLGYSSTHDLSEYTKNKALRAIAANG